MKYLLRFFVLFALVVIAHGTASAAELRHYDVLVFPYDDDIYEMKATELTHNAYKSYTLKASLKAFKRRNTEEESAIHFNIGFFNDIKYDTVDAWITASKEILVENQKLGNDMTLIGEGKLGDDTRYLAVAADIDPDDKFGTIEYQVGYIRLGRMLTMQIFFHGDTANEVALRGFLRMANDAIHRIADGETKPFTGSLELAATWRGKVKRGK